MKTKNRRSHIGLNALETYAGDLFDLCFMDEEVYMTLPIEERIYVSKQYIDAYDILFYHYLHTLNN